MTETSFQAQIQFSACGKYISVKHDSASLPEITKIPFYILDLVHCFKENESSSSYRNSVMESDTSMTSTWSTYDPTRTRVAQEGWWDRRPVTASRVMSTDHVDGKVIVRSLQNGVDKQQELLKLPAWADERLVGISVHKSPIEVNAIRIVLDKAAQPWYDLADRDEVHLPAVVDRTRESIRERKRVESIEVSDSKEDESTKKRKIDGAPAALVAPRARRLEAFRASSRDSS